MDNHKTAAENLLNLKLDALHGAVVMLAKASPYTDDAVLIVSDIDDAWRDEDAEPRKVGKADPLKIEVKPLTAANIFSSLTASKISTSLMGESSDGELRRRVARLLGATNVIRGAQSGVLMGYFPEEDEGRGEGWKLIEDYPKDRTAAMTLADRLEKLGYVTIITNRASGDLKAVRVLDGEAKLLPRVALANVQDVTLARAITRAFIEVMEGKTDA